MLEEQKRKALNHDTANSQQVNYDGLQILVTETAQVQSTNQEPNLTNQELLPNQEILHLIWGLYNYLIPLTMSPLQMPTLEM
jgi:hypothetical protein